MSETTWIYGLYCPSSKRIRYVGASIHPARRFRAHLVSPDRGAKAVQEWIQELQRAEIKPELVLLEKVEVRSGGVGIRHPVVAEAEDRWIVKLINEGHPLTNSRLPAELTTDQDEEIFRQALERGREMFG